MKLIIPLGLTLLQLVAGYHWHHHPWKPMEPPEPEQIDALAAVLEKLAPKLEAKAEEESCFDKKVQGRFCYGWAASETFGQAVMQCEGDDNPTRCFYTAMGWLDESGILNRGEVQNTISSTLMDTEELLAAEQMCSDARAEIDESTIEAIINGDYMEGMTMSQSNGGMSMRMGGGRGFRGGPGGRGGRGGRGGGWGHGGGRGSGHWGKWEDFFNNMNNMQPEPELTNVDTAIIVVQNLAYFDCVEEALDSACSEQINSFLDLVPFDPSTIAAGWEASGIVESRLDGEIPPPAVITFPESGVVATAGDTVLSEMMNDPPVPVWDCDPEKLYTYLVEDNGINGDGPLTFAHYLVYNIPNCDVSQGQVAFDYVPSFSFNLENGQLITDNEDFFHPHVHLIYEQSGPIEIEEQQSGCNPELTTARLGVGDNLPNHVGLEEKYGLGDPVAGSVIINPYTEATNQYICDFSRCLGSPFPFPLPGVNDGPECQPGNA